MDDLAFVSAEETAALVRTGDASPREVVEAALRRIEALDPALNAFIEVDGERALAEADAVVPGDAAPFAGVPIAIKGNTPVEGWELNNGSRFLAGQRPDHSAYLVRRLREAGLRRSWASRTCPSSGSCRRPSRATPGRRATRGTCRGRPAGRPAAPAAAVAAGMLPIAHGNDGGGSIRIPASCCGLVGLKPSRGRVSRGPDLGDSWLACDGVLTRTVADTALALDVLGGYEVGDANWAPRPVEPYVDLDAALPRASCGSPSRPTNPFDADVDEEAIHGLRVAAELLQALGHEVEEAAPAVAVRRVAGGLHQRLRPGDRARHRRRRPARGPRAGRGRARAAVARGLRAGSPDARRWPTSARVAQLQALARGLVAFFADYDLLVTPGLAERPLPIGECNGLGEEPMKDLARSGLFTPYTSLFNVTGQPAISIPVGLRGGRAADQRADRRQAAVRGHAAAGRVQMEAAHPWAHQRPSVA